MKIRMLRENPEEYTGYNFTDSIFALNFCKDNKIKMDLKKKRNEVHFISTMTI